MLSTRTLPPRRHPSLHCLNGSVAYPRAVPFSEALLRQPVLFTAASTWRCYANPPGVLQLDDEKRAQIAKLHKTASVEEEGWEIDAVHGPMTTLSVFATRPSPAPDPSRYRVPALVPQAAALDFRTPFSLAQVRRFKVERFQEEMGIFKIAYERPFLQEYKSVLAEKQAQMKAAATAARREVRKRRKAYTNWKSLHEVEEKQVQAEQKQAHTYPMKMPEHPRASGEELARYFDFILGKSSQDIYNRLYPEFFGDTRDNIKAKVPPQHYPYIWDSFFDPENPDNFYTQEEVEDDIWEFFNKSTEEVTKELDDELESTAETFERLAAWELDPARFKGKWVPRDWPKEELELSHIKQRARKLRYLREQLKKHGLLSDHTSEREALQQLQAPTGGSSVTVSEREVFFSFNDSEQPNAAGPTDATPSAISLDNIESFLDDALPEGRSEEEIQAAKKTSEQNSAWEQTKQTMQQNIMRIIESGAGEEIVKREFLKLVESDPHYGTERADPAMKDLATKLEGPLMETQIKLYNPNSEEAMERARVREAQRHKLEEPVKLPWNSSKKEQIFAEELVPGQPAIEFIHRYSLEPDVVRDDPRSQDFFYRKVILKVHVPSLNLPPAAQERLLALVGSRYDATSGVLKLVGEKHPTRSLNKQYLKLLMKELLHESFLACPRYSPFSDLNITDLSSLRNYTLPNTVQSQLDGQTPTGEWEYKMFSFPRLDGHYPFPKEYNEQATMLRQRLASALS